MKLSWQEIVEAAQGLNVGPCFIWAVASNESGGRGFDGAGRVLVRFEKHVFKRELRKRGVAQEILSAAERLKGVRWDTLNIARSIHEEAALRATSFGMFQIMGFNHKSAGFDSVFDFVKAHEEGESKQLEAFCSFVRHERLLEIMRQGDCKQFARRYNGPAYADNRYDTKLEQAHGDCLKKRGL